MIIGFIMIFIGMLLVMFHYSGGKWKQYLLGMLGCLLIGFAIPVSDFYEAYYDKKHISQSEKIIVSEQLAFEDSVKLYIESLNLAHPDIVLKQARIESGNFTSKIFKDNMNLFGMRDSYYRPTVSIGVNRGYAVYEDWKHSVIDYALLQAWSYKKLNREEYLKQLSISYAEDTLYIQKVK